MTRRGGFLEVNLPPPLTEAAYTDTRRERADRRSIYVRLCRRLCRLHDLELLLSRLSVSYSAPHPRQLRRYVPRPAGAVMTDGSVYWCEDNSVIDSLLRLRAV